MLKTIYEGWQELKRLGYDVASLQRFGFVPNPNHKYCSLVDQVNDFVAMTWCFLGPWDEDMGEV